MEVKERIASTESRLAALEEWQKRQNGAIHRVEDKVEKLQFWIMGTAVSAFMNLLLFILTFLIQKG